MNSLAEATIHQGEVPAPAGAPFKVLKIGPAYREATVSVSQDNYKWAPSTTCRWLNVAVAVLALVLCAPLMLFISVLVKLSSPGPVIYKQTRVGVDRRSGDGGKWADRRKVDYGGRLFTIYKFRTMRTDSGSTVQVWAKPGDARVTAVGRVLRKYRLDELPQLFNVIKGDMNIVGPRPEQPMIFATLREQVEMYSARQRVLPGITGWAQVNLNYDACLDDVRQKIKYDLEYIKSQSILQDLRILMLTIPVMLFRRGAW